jgi:hypothetical protein
MRRLASNEHDDLQTANETEADQSAPSEVSDTSLQHSPEQLLG